MVLFYHADNAALFGQNPHSNPSGQQAFRVQSECCGTGATALSSGPDEVQDISVALGRSQVVRQRFLVPSCAGSNPAAPTILGLFLSSNRPLGPPGSRGSGHWPWHDKGRHRPVPTLSQGFRLVWRRASLRARQDCRMRRPGEFQGNGKDPAITPDPDGRR